jgi:hypothetical protein
MSPVVGFPGGVGTGLGHTVLIQGHKKKKGRSEVIGSAQGWSINRKWGNQSYRAAVGGASTFRIGMEVSIRKFDPLYRRSA